MRKMLVVGAGQAGLQLALGLQSHGYEVTVMSNRTADEIRGGRVMSTQVMFGPALRHERDLGLDFWADRAPRIDGVGVSIAPSPAGRGAAGDRVRWLGRLEQYAQSVDQRVKMAGWLDTFVGRGGQLVVHGAAVSDLDHLVRRYDLVLVAAGKGELVAMFERNPARSPYRTPRRALAVSYVHGLAPHPEHPGTEALCCTIVPGVGELFVIPALSTSGRCDILFWEAFPGGPADVFSDVRDPAEHLAATLELMEAYVPWEYARATRVELTDGRGTLSGRYPPTVREPVGRLPGGGSVLGVGDVVVANDPITGQGANSAAVCAAEYLACILERGGEPFDEEWMRRTFERYWEVARHATRWSNAMLAPRPAHVRRLFTAAADHQPLADRIANGFADPSDFTHWLYDPGQAERLLAGIPAE